MKWLTLIQTGANVTSFQPLMKHSTVPSHHIWHTSVSPVYSRSHDSAKFTFLFYSFPIVDWSLWIPGGWNFQTEIPCYWQTLEAAWRTYFLLHWQWGRHHLVLQQYCNYSICFSDCMHWKSQLKSVIIFFVGLYVGNCRGVWGHAGFCRASLLWRVPTIWSRLLQCKWWRIKCSCSSGWVI